MTSIEPTLWDGTEAEFVLAIAERRRGEVAELVEPAEGWELVVGQLFEWVDGLAA